MADHVKGRSPGSGWLWWLGVLLVGGGTVAVLVLASTRDLGGRPVTIAAAAVMVAIALRIIRRMVFQRRSAQRRQPDLRP
ncbi:hypothetical protein [Serinicoccus sp. LYQ131]|uniref:hypothetical protein n=1 Tax=Serinicoccus sp. LYQ131 TaxID=3378797 RepID=UPI003854961C